MVKWTIPRGKGLFFGHFLLYFLPVNLPEKKRNFSGEKILPKKAYFATILPQYGRFYHCFLVGFDPQLYFGPKNFQNPEKSSFEKLQGKKNQPKMTKK